MSYFPVAYNEPLFRPPSEGKSVIIQVTLGCSWNKCAFCEMYTSKHFTVRPLADVLADIESFAPYSAQITKVFLADGDPLVLSNARLVPILKKITATFPNLRRISTYASPSNINRKSEAELQELKSLGLTLLYVGIESGDSHVLEAIQKGETFESTVSGIQKATAAKIDTSVMIITGVGGRKYSHQHAIQSAKLVNIVQPKYLSTLVLTAHKGLAHYKSRYIGEFTPLSPLEVFEEMHTFISHTQLNETIFRSDHASNRLVLKGILGRDKERFLLQIAAVQKYGNAPHLRSQNFGGY